MQLSKNQYMAAILFIAVCGLSSSYWLSPSKESFARSKVVEFHTDASKNQPGAHLKPRSISEPSSKLARFSRAAETSSQSTLAPDMKNQTHDEDANLAESQALKILEKQNYQDLSPVEIESFLEMMTLGEGQEFDKNKVAQLQNLEDLKNRSPQSLAYLQDIQGTFRSEFVNAVPVSKEEPYKINVKFDGTKIEVTYTLSGNVYYQHTFEGIMQTVKTSRSESIPANFFLELPAKPEVGYLHPMFLEILVGSDRRTLLGIFYNTDQTVPSGTHYLHAEDLIFNKVN